MEVAPNPINVSVIFVIAFPQLIVPELPKQEANTVVTDPIKPTCGIITGFATAHCSLSTHPDAGVVVTTGVGVVGTTTGTGVVTVAVDVVGT